MTTFLAGTDSVTTSEKLLGYLDGRAEDGDTVYVINSLVGGDQTSDNDVVEGTEAMKVLEEGIGAEGHQLVRGNSPQEDLLEFADKNDVDELVIGIRKRSPTGKMLFGSTAQDILLETDLPVVAVPLVEAP